MLTLYHIKIGNIAISDMNNLVTVINEQNPMQVRRQKYKISDNNMRFSLVTS